MMKFKSFNTSYFYNPRDNTITTLKGKLVEDKELVAVAIRIMDNIKAEGYKPTMSFKIFENYISVLDTEEKNELFHKILDSYLYVTEWINEKNRSTSEYFKGMAKIKRWERYLYMILQS